LRITAINLTASFWSKAALISRLLTQKYTRQTAKNNKTVPPESGIFFGENKK